MLLSYRLPTPVYTVLMIIAVVAALEIICLRRWPPKRRVMLLTWIIDRLGVAA